MAIDLRIYVHGANPFSDGYNDAYWGLDVEDNIVLRWAKSPMQGITRDEYTNKYGRDPFRLPTAREIATGNVHNVYTLDDGLIPFAPYPVV